MDNNIIGATAADAPSRSWGWRSALLAWILVVASGFGALYYPPRLGRFAVNLVLLLLLATVAVGVCWRWIFPPRGRRAAPRWVLALILLGCVGFLIAWYVHYEPVFGPYSDNADALERGVRELAAGRDPYHVVTKLNSPLSPLLGGLLWAAPFVLLTGGVWWQQVVWLVGGAVALWRGVGLRAAAAGMLLFSVDQWTLMALPNQSDHWPTATLIALTGIWGCRAVKRGRIGVSAVLSALAFGTAIADRFTLLAVALPLAVLLLRRSPRRAAWAWLGIAAATCVVLLVLPACWDLGAYLHGPLAVGSAHAGRGSRWMTVAVALVSLVVLLVSSWAVRRLADVWAAVSVTLAAMVATIIVTRLGTGLHAAVTGYDAVAFNGAWLVFGIVALVLPRSAQFGDVSLEQGARRG